MEQNEELIGLSDTISMRENAPWFGSFLNIDEYTKVVIECFNSIEKSSNVREIVLETWLILDYFVRMVLSNLWELDEFNNEEKDFDLKNELLPSFENCLRLLERILTIQRSLNENPISHLIKVSFGFWLFIKKEHPDFHKKFLEVEEDYYQKYYPQLSRKSQQETWLYSSSKPLNVLSSKQRYCVNKGWVNGLSNLDEEWFKLARKLNKARNKSAHSHDPSSIAKAFGYSGANETEHIKQECLGLIDKLIGIVKMPKDQMEGNSP